MSDELLFTRKNFNLFVFAISLTAVNILVNLLVNWLVTEHKVLLIIVSTSVIVFGIVFWALLIRDEYIKVKHQRDVLEKELAESSFKVHSLQEQIEKMQVESKNKPK